MSATSPRLARLNRASADMAIPSNQSDLGRSPSPDRPSERVVLPRSAHRCGRGAADAAVPHPERLGYSVRMMPRSTTLPTMKAMELAGLRRAAGLHPQWTDAAVGLCLAALSIATSHFAPLGEPQQEVTGYHA